MDYVRKPVRTMPRVTVFSPTKISISSNIFLSNPIPAFINISTFLNKFPKSVRSLTENKFWLMGQLTKEVFLTFLPIWSRNLFQAIRTLHSQFWLLSEIRPMSVITEYISRFRFLKSIRRHRKCYTAVATV